VIILLIGVLVWSMSYNIVMFRRLKDYNCNELDLTGIRAINFDRIPRDT